MYTIAQVIYGVPIEVDFDKYYPSELLKEGEEYVKVLEKAFNEESHGFLEFYSGSSQITPRAFGIYLDQFNGYGYMDIEEIQEKLNKEIMTQYKEIFNKLEQNLKKEVKKFGKPRVFIMFSTS